jgi:UDP-glucose 4-epimerase
MARVVVTGGAGFIGSHISDAFLGAGHHVAIIDNFSSGSRENVDPKIKIYEADIRSAEARRALEAEQPDIVVHTAAQISVRLSMEDPVFDTEVNVAGVVNLLHAFNGKQYPHFVFLSTGGAIYGEQETFPASESHRIAPASIYGLAKRVGEMYFEFWAREHGMKFTALRLANVYGPRQNAHGEAGVVAIFNTALLAGKAPTIFGSGEQTRDFVYVGDVVAAAKAVSERGICGTFNIGTAVETDVNKLYSMISKALNVSLVAFRGPAKAGEQMRSSIDATFATKTFNWKPQVDLEQGIGLTAKWFAQTSRSK